jgi:uncharacterized protein (TIGR03067 family)
MNRNNNRAIRTFVSDENINCADLANKSAPNQNRWQRGRRICLVVLSLFFVFGAFSLSGCQKSDEAQIVGTWEMVEFWRAGQRDLDDEARYKFKAVFTKGGKYEKSKQGGKPEVFEYKLVDSLGGNSPKQIELKDSGGSKSYIIFKIEGDVLTIGEGGKDKKTNAPKTFEEAKRSYVLKRL